LKGLLDGWRMGKGSKLCFFLTPGLPGQRVEGLRKGGVEVQHSRDHAGEFGVSASLAGGCG
jgi:hypothetical protein